MHFGITQTPTLYGNAGLISSFQRNSQQKRCWKVPMSTTPLSFDAHPRELPRISASTWYCQKVIIGLHFCRCEYESIFVQIFVVGSEKRMFCAIECVTAVQSSKIVDFGTNRKGVCDFLLAINSNIGPILIVSEIRRLVAWKLQVFLLHSYNALARVEPFRISWWTFYCQDQSIWAIRRWKFREPSLRRFDRVPTCDGQTDEWTDRRTTWP